MANIDLAALVAFYRGQGGLAIVTVVKPRTQFGVTQLAEHARALASEGKPRLDHWVNGGFFMLEPGFVAYGELGSVLENDPLRRVTADRQLHAFRHTEFWKRICTHKDG